MALFREYTDNPSQLALIDDAIAYAINQTNNNLFVTDRNSAYRILVEAQAYVYNLFIKLLRESEDELLLVTLQLFGIDAKAEIPAKVRLKITVIGDPITSTFYIPEGFEVRATNGSIFTTDTILALPIGVNTGYVNATALKPGNNGNVAAGTVNTPIRILSRTISVTNEQPATGGKDALSLFEATEFLSKQISANGLVTLDDYLIYFEETYPSYIINVSVTGINLTIYAVSTSGTALTQVEKDKLQADIEAKKIIGTGSVTIADMTVIDIHVKYDILVTKPINYDELCDRIAEITFEFLSVANSEQSTGRIAGTIYQNTLANLINLSDVDIVKKVKIGDAGQTLTANDYVFDNETGRVSCVEVKVEIFTDDTNSTVFTRTR